MRQPIKSPIQATVNSPLFLVKLAADLLKVHTKFLERVDTFVNESKSIREEATRIKSLPKGDKGDRGEKGDTIVGPKGNDGRDGRDGRDGESIDPVIVAELAAQLITRPKDGKDSPSLEAIVQAVIDLLKESDALEIDKRMIGFRNEVASYRNQLAGKVYGKDTWARGGGSSSGGSSTPLIPTGTVDSVNATFGVTSRPSSVVSDGITYFEGAGYLYAALTITLDIPPSQYIRYYT